MHSLESKIIQYPCTSHRQAGQGVTHHNLQQQTRTDDVYLLQTKWPRARRWSPFIPPMIVAGAPIGIVRLRWLVARCACFASVHASDERACSQWTNDTYERLKAVHNCDFRLPTNESCRPCIRRTHASNNVLSTGPSPNMSII